MAEKIKQVKANVPEEIHRRLRMALAADQMSFATWMYQRITDYLQKAGQLKGVEGSKLAHLYLNNGEVYEDEKPVKARKPVKKGKGKEA